MTLLSMLAKKVKNRALIYLLAVFAVFCLFPSSVHSQTTPPAAKDKVATSATMDKKSGAIRVTDVVAPAVSKDQDEEEEIKSIAPISYATQAIVLSMLALAPFCIMLLTSFIKMVVVLSLLRNAVGAQSTPPNQVINGVALMLTLYVMFPTGLKMYDACQDLLEQKPKGELVSGETARFIYEVANVAKEPLREFLLRQTDRPHLQSFYQMSYRVVPKKYQEKIQPESFVILIPSYVTSQLKHAFEVAVMVFLPFFVVDLVTSNILLAMGMQMLSPMTISLPLKLLLLVMVDGWTLIIQGLVLSYFE